MIPWSGFSAHCDGVDFVGDAFDWEPGFYVKTIDGISGGGAVSFDSAPAGVGIANTPNRRDDPRIISMTGFIYASSMRMLGQSIDQFGAMLAEDDDERPFEWSQYGQARRYALVRRFTSQEPTREGDTGFATFRISFRASDQRIYGPASTTAWGSVVKVEHKGGYPAPVVVEVRGNSQGGYTIAGPRGRTAVVQRPIVPGSIHRYDGDFGLLEIDGVPQTTGVTRSDRLEVPHGEFQFAVDPGCEIRVTFSPTWAP